MSPVAFQFERKGIIRVTPSTQTTATQDELFEKLFAVVVDAGAEDVRVLAPDDEGGEEAMTVYEVGETVVNGFPRRVAEMCLVAGSDHHPTKPSISHINPPLLITYLRRTHSGARLHADQPTRRS
jgi:transcriptional/translational regulatory protein YebC/TACO1